MKSALCPPSMFTSGAQATWSARLGERGRYLLPLVLACCLPAAAGARQPSVLQPLLPLSRAMVARAGAAGTGCSWLLPDDRHTRFAAADDRAIVRLATGVVRLRPRAGAGDLFPSTYDRWVGNGIAVTVLPVGAASQKGSEAWEGAATIEVTVGARTRVIRGRLNCGS